MRSKTKNVKKRSLSADHDRSTGMAVALAMLLLWFAFRRDACVFASAALLACAMTVPVVLRPLSILWYGLSDILGAVSSRIILSVIYLLIVFPVGFARRIAGRDELMLRDFKKSRASVFREQDRLIEGKDVCNPY
ncbi:MAG: SxtJ family membrane protein [Chitinispirillales bacterium]|jgi:hypothetical protein|nr:SxtJ family membrane protein [Chitinispirillales bacterium]